MQLYQLDHPQAGVPTMKDLVDTYVPSETCPDGKMITIDENGNVSAT
ncbi:MAG: hypothetical protein ACRC17_02095 [Culicoidibacterales bacterium]